MLAKIARIIARIIASLCLGQGVFILSSALACSCQNCPSVVIAAHKMRELGDSKCDKSRHLLCEFTSLKEVHENFVGRM